MKTTRKAIETFLSAKKMAIAGVSRNPKKFGYAIYSELSGKGFEVYPINPNADSIDGKPCFAGISNLPPDVKNLLIVTRKDQTLGLLRDALSKGITSIWIQQMSNTPEAIRFATENKMDIISKQCILMWAEPVKSIHRFHRNVKKLFGLLPK